MTKMSLNRRAMLKGLLGGAAIGIALPPLEAMLNANGTAYAGGTPIPKRFGFFYWGNGVIPSRWNPPTQGAGWELSEQLAPLSSVKDYVNVVSGFDIKTGNPRGHHAGTVGILSGAPLIEQEHAPDSFASTFSQASLDQVIAAEIGMGTRFRSLEVGVSRSIVTSEGTTLQYLSHNGPDNVNPAEYDPYAVYRRLFTEGFTPPGVMAEIDPRWALRRSVLGAVMEDANRLHTRLGVNDRLRLEQHLDSIRSIETRLIAMIEAPPPPPSACMMPGEPMVPGETGGIEPLAAVSSVMNDLVAMALACDQTRVFSNMYNGSVSGTRFADVGASDGHHSLTHDEAGDQPLVNEITKYIMSHFADLLVSLRDIPEGDGNLLDSCCILASSDTASGRDHTKEDYPVLIAGRAQGFLRYPSVHYRSPSAENTSNILLTCLRAMGMPRTSFGYEGGYTETPCSAIETG